MIRFTNPNRLALLISAANSLFISMVYGVGIMGNMIPFSWPFFFIINALLFLFSYFFIRYIIQNFIFQKIKVIYKIIRSLKLSRTEKLEWRSNLGEDMIGQVSQDVMDWAENKTAEIEQLRNIENYRREFLANVSHELKTPISNMQGYISTLISGGIDDPEINRDYLQKTEKNINRLIELVDDLDIISSLESGEVNMDKSKFDMRALTREVFEFLEDSAKSRGISFLFGNDDNNPVFVYADRYRIRQVLVNLVDNSIKYGRDGGRTKVSFYDMDDNYLIEVSDNGIGIEEQHIPRLFERFYRVDKHRSRTEGGTGLGLAIVKHILEAHDQTVNVRSSPKIGSTFSFTLRKG
ncbi:MAG TPA: ATP-binding protein [Bacteroidales bacterium]|nr:ATP-binding protein [Bacteroidales bacterium]HOX77607.1 ATP-binding protein [Bacteroidales bacterium]HPI86076.1 ATP-binding protein [Bacteroidales bacterium]HPM91203.1 ATP-binding protein [Bacteroidales bacterium]